MRNFKSVRFAWSKEILNGVVLYKAAKPKNHDFEYTVLAKGKRLNNTSDKSVVMKHRSGDVKILLSVEHGLTRRRYGRTKLNSAALRFQSCFSLPVSL